MQYRITCAILFIMLMNVAGCLSTDKPESSPQYLGIVKVSKLASRKDASVNSELIRYYSFGTPLKLIARSSARAVVNGIEDYWYRDEATMGWLFGGYMLLSGYEESKIFRFEIESIRCNEICGGMSCFFEFQPYLVGSRYIATFYLNDYPEGNAPQFGIIIGDYELTENTIKFSNARFLAGYDDKANYINDIMSKDFDTKEYLFKGLEREYNRYTDEEGAYYIYSGTENNQNRAKLRAKCRDAANTEEVWAVFYQLKAMTINEMQSYFPLVEIKGDKYLVK